MNQRNSSRSPISRVARCQRNAAQRHHRSKNRTAIDRGAVDRFARCRRRLNDASSLVSSRRADDRGLLPMQGRARSDVGVSWYRRRKNGKDAPQVDSAVDWSELAAIVRGR
jgi:hypothetical protein